MLKHVVPLCSSNPAHRYYLATDPVTGELYVSDTNTRRIYRPKLLTGAKDLTKNFDVVAGTGEQCLPFDEARCGDGGKAVEATLMSPKGGGNSQFLRSAVQSAHDCIYCCIAFYSIQCCQKAYLQFITG